MADNKPVMDDLAIHSIVKLAQSAEVKTHKVEGGAVPFVVIPGDSKVEYLDKCFSDTHALSPKRIKDKVSVFDPESFIEYYNQFSDENSRTFADEKESTVVTVIDYHGAKTGAPRWGGHRLTLTMRLSEQWAIWTARNNQSFTQQQFAEFLEQNSSDITKPDPALMVDIARDLEGTIDAQFAGGVRNDNGQFMFRYSEDIKTKVGGNDKVQIPTKFTITIPPYVGGASVNVEVLMRFRLKDGKLTFFYTLVRPNDHLRTAFALSRRAIADALKVTIINGTPA